MGIRKKFLEHMKAIALTVILIPLCACSWFGSGAKRDPYIDARETCEKEV